MGIDNDMGIYTGIYYGDFSVGTVTDSSVDAGERERDKERERALRHRKVP